jgi:hypothetical protein
MRLPNPKKTLPEEQKNDSENPSVAKVIPENSPVVETVSSSEKPPSQIQ